MVVKSDFLYIPFGHKNVTDKVYFDLCEALKTLIEFDKVIRYKIQKDPTTYEITLCQCDTYTMKTLKFRYITPKLTFYHRDN